MHRPLLLLAAASLLFGAAAVARVETQAAKPGGTAGTWNPAAAGRYLDQRMAWWRAWPKAQRDHGTVCVSCHTALPVALARPGLRGALRESAPSAAEQAMLGDVTKRVTMWREVEPFYSDQKVGLPKTSESRAVEAVLNALILVARDRETGRLGADTRQAFANMWPLQMQTGDLKGGFAWLTFKLEPWESVTATYWGATLAAVAIGRAPEGYAASPDIQPKVELLRAYLRGGLTSQSLFSRMLILWADDNLHGILEPAQRQHLIAELIAAQNADGGWSLTRLSTWQRVDGSAIADASDGFATAIVALAFKDLGRDLGKDAPAASLKAARHWLATHQDAQTGAVPAVSINKKRAPDTDAYLFMTDAATGYAALAMSDRE